VQETSYTDASEWDPWTDEVSFAPTIEDQAKAATLFNQDPVEPFEAWVESLPDCDFVTISRALTTLRSAIQRYHAEKNEWDPTVVTIEDILGEF
jgi:hypothetical protein